MNRQVQKDRLKDIIEGLEGVKQELEDKQEGFEAIEAAIDDLDSMFADTGCPYSWNVDGLKSETLTAVLENTALQDMQDEVESFQSDLEEHMDSLSDYAREKLEERYTELDNVVGLFDVSDCTSVDDVIQRIDDIIGNLKEMRA
jgi:DNA repair exonuclease SbcCD ATPase subunit